MKDIETDVSHEFVLNLDSIAYDLVRCFGLKHEKKIENLSEPLLRWLDFRLRYIDPKPRKVYLSNKFPKKISRETKDALIRLIQMIQCGENINPYQGKGLILHHDISGRKRQQRTDLLWADWGITHLHLSNKPIPKDEYFSARAENGWLLFGIVGDNFFACIDIRQHNEKAVFSNTELFKTVVETWPEMMEKFELKGISPPAPADVLRSEEHGTARKSGLSAGITIGEKVYMGLGGGITTASTPLKVTRAMDTAREYIRNLAFAVCDADGEFQSVMRSSAIKEPDFKLCITPRGLAVYEPHIDKAWLLPNKMAGSESNYLADLHDLVAPVWATDRLFSSE